MKKLFLLLALLVPLTLNAQLLYKVSGGNLTEDSYLFGTHHLTPFSFTDNVPGFAQALENSSQVYGEILLDSKSTAAFSQKMMPVIMMPSDTLFRDIVTEEEYAYIDSQIKKYLGATTSLDQMAVMKPATISMQLTNIVAMQDENGKMRQTGTAMDVAIQQKAIESGKTVGGLETIETQLALLFGKSLEDQAEELIRSLKSGDLREENKKLSALYEAKDSKGLFAHVEESLASAVETESEAAEAMDEMAYNRNTAWAEALPSIMESGSTFVAVGAAHLQGTKGLIQLLRDKGYTVTAVE